MPDPTPPQPPPQPPPQRRLGPYEQSLIESRARREAREAELAARAARRRSRVIAAVIALLLLTAGVLGGLYWRHAREAASSNGASVHVSRTTTQPHPSARPVP